LAPEAVLTPQRSSMNWRALDFLEYFGRNLNAFNDCTRDVVTGDYRSDLGATGFVLVLRHYDALIRREAEAAHAVVDIIANQCRNGALIGHRMICLLQSDDPKLHLPPVGATPGLWNDAEWLDARCSTRTFATVELSADHTNERRQLMDDRYEVIDRQLGVALTEWFERNRTWLPGLSIQGPLPAPGMDPTWIVQLRDPRFEFELFLFRGPHVELNWFDPTVPQPAPEVAGYDDIVPSELAAVLDETVARLR
jgi:hypothetical protein